MEEVRRARTEAGSYHQDAELVDSLVSREGEVGRRNDPRLAGRRNILLVRDLVRENDLSDLSRARRGRSQRPASGRATVCRPCDEKKFLTILSS